MDPLVSNLTRSHDVFRGKFIEALRQSFAAGKLRFHRRLKGLAQRRLFGELLRQAFHPRWIAYCKRPLGGPDQVLRYLLGAYTHRVAISHHRRVAWADDQVTFRWRDSAPKNKNG